MAQYEFIDTVEYSQEGSILPVEAMSYNGIYIENEITGYRTLYTSGRELLVSELQTGEINGIDGARYLGRRRPIRTITVGYQLIADSPSDFREKYNKLNSLLRKEQVQIIFADEPDKYFIGTKTGNSTVESGRNAVTGEIEITCVDPYKYALEEKAFTAEFIGGKLLLNVKNDGTEPCPVSFKISNKSDNGYVSLISSNGIMRYGNQTEVDGVTVRGNEVLSTIADWPATRETSSVMHPTYNYTGTLKKVTNVNGGKTVGMVIDSFGNRLADTWNGGCQELTLPADSTGATGSKNFYCWMCHWFMTSQLGQTGEQGIAFITDDNKMICGVQIVKSDASGNDAYIEYFVNGKIKRQIHFQPTVYDSDNPFNGRGANDIRKEGSKVTFYWWGSHFSYVDPDIENLECAKIQLTFDNHGTRASYVAVNAISEIKFEKMDVNGWKDVPNRYKEGDEIIIDGDDSKVYINGIYKPNEEVIGTKYFQIDPLDSAEITIAVSDWCETVPDVEATIRERWL